MRFVHPPFYTRLRAGRLLCDGAFVSIIVFFPLRAMFLRKLIKSALTRLPGKRLIFSAIRSFGVPPFYRSLRFDGSFPVRLTRETFILLQNMDEYSLETEWFWRGIAGWEAASIQIWMNLCRSQAIGATPTIMDIGACEGIYALVASALAPDSNVVAVEPFPEAFKRLEANVSLNKKPIYTFEAACSDSDGSAAFYSDGNANSTEASLLSSGTVGRTSTCVVKTRSVDSLLRELGLSSIDLVKIDVEGAEPGVIKGMEDYLASSRPVILVEVLNDKVAEELAEIMSRWNYHYWDINDDPRNGALGARLMPCIRNGICLNWLFVPTEKESHLRKCWSEWLIE